MAKGAKSSSLPFKVSFGKKITGIHKKSQNKHDRTEKNYRGQGR